MKSIEERAEEFASVYPHDMQHFLEECYITVATEQEKITKKEMIIKAHHTLEKVLAKEMLDELIKALKEE